MAKKENENARVVRFLVQYNGLKDLLKRTNIQKILAGNASFTGSMAESDLDALKAAQRYVEFIGRNLRIGNESIDQYFSRLQGVYTGADLSKRVSIHDANYPAYVASVLGTDQTGGVQRVAQAIEDNDEVKKAVANLPLALGKEKGLSYVATMTHYLALSASISGLNGNITELQNSNRAERDKNKRLSELIAERNKRLADLEKVDAGFLALMEQTKKNASQESVDALMAEISLLRTSILESVKPVELDGVKKSIKTAEQTLLKRINATDTHIVDGIKNIVEQVWGANALTMTAIDNNHKALRRAIGAAQARGIAETRQQGDRVVAHTTTEAQSTRTHVTTEGQSTRTHVTAEADRVIAEFNKAKSGWGGRKHPVRDTLIVVLCAFGLIGGGLGAGYAIWGTEEQASSSEVRVDEGYQQKYDDLFASMGVDFKHYNDFVNSVNSAKEDNVISRTEYADLAALAAQPASTADFPRTQMETAVLDNAIYSTELAQYDAVKAMVDGYVADGSEFDVAEQAEVQVAIDGYNAENIEGKFNSAALMSATVDSAREYSELNILYNNLLSSQPGTETPAPNYSKDMKVAMETLQVALSDSSLSQEEVAVLDEIIAKLDATGDENAELFAEKLDSVIDTFVAQQVENAQLAENMGVDFKHYNDFVNSVNSAKEDNVISRTEYADLVALAAQPASTADFPRTQMETAVLNNAIYSTELAQYDAVKAMVDGYVADGSEFDVAEQAEVQAIIDGYNAENIEGKFNSAALMSATVDSARKYSELNLLYYNLLNSQPGTETPAPNYSADMKAAMETLQVALSDGSLSQEEVAVLDEIIAKLDATGDENAELFAEKLAIVINTFVDQETANVDLQSQIAQSQDIILDYYYEYTGKNGTLEEALAFFAQTNSNQGNQQGSSSADPEAPSYGK